MPKKQSQNTAMWVWTKMYLPLTMGGEIWQNRKAEVPVSEKHDLGKGYFGVLFCPEEAGYFVAESTSGAIIGGGATVEAALAEVREDIRVGSEETMARQIKTAIIERDNMESISTEEFIRKMALNARGRWSCG
jgi:hypothetical protein